MTKFTTDIVWLLLGALLGSSGMDLCWDYAVVAAFEGVFGRSGVWRSKRCYSSPALKPRRISYAK